MASKRGSSLFSRTLTCQKEVGTREVAAGKEDPEVLSASPVDSNQRVGWQGRNRDVRPKREQNAARDSLEAPCPTWGESALRHAASS